jgi:hypothetical protein
MKLLCCTQKPEIEQWFVIIMMITTKTSAAAT